MFRGKIFLYFAVVFLLAGCTPSGAPAIPTNPANPPGSGPGQGLHFGSFPINRPSPTAGPNPTATLGPNTPTPTAAPPTPIEPLLPTSAPGSTVRYSPAPIGTGSEDSYGLLRNPDMGWSIHGSTDVLASRFPEATAIGYERTDMLWRTLEPQEGKFDWSIINGGIANMLKSGGKFAFRVKTASGNGKSTPDIPDWAIQAGASGKVTKPSCYEVTTWEPDYKTCAYLTKHGNFVQNLVKTFDGNPGISFIEIGSLGYYGEWHSGYFTCSADRAKWQCDASGRCIKGLLDQIKERVIKMYSGGSGVSDCTDASGKFITQNYNYKEGVKNSLLLGLYQANEITKNNLIGVRYDSLGSGQGGQDGDLVDYIKTHEIWKTALIGGEFGSGSAPSQSNLDYMIQHAAPEGHLSFINSTGQTEGGDDSQWRTLLRKIGYRFMLTFIEYPKNGTTGTSLPIKMVWQNLGSAPVYKKYPLLIYLTNGTGNEVVKGEIATDARTWLPSHQGSNNTYNVNGFLNIPCGTPAGSYDLRLAIVDPSSGKPALSFPFRGKDAVGRYLVSSQQITITTDQTCR